MVGAAPFIERIQQNWRDTKKISAQVFQKVAGENAVKLLGLT